MQIQIVFCKNCKSHSKYLKIKTTHEKNLSKVLETLNNYSNLIINTTLLKTVGYDVKNDTQAPFCESLTYIITVSFKRRLAMRILNTRMAQSNFFFFKYNLVSIRHTNNIHGQNKSFTSSAEGKVEIHYRTKSLWTANHHTHM